MQCEVCGKSIMGKPYKTIIEGARLVVCHDCSVLGSISWELKTPNLKPLRRNVHRQQRRSQQKSTKGPKSPLESSMELVPDYGIRIRKAREKSAFTHEDLGRRINEKISVLKKLENQKMKPDDRLVEKLQRALRIRLLVPRTDGSFPPHEPSRITPSKTLTLGDLIKKKPSEEAK